MWIRIIIIIMLTTTANAWQSLKYDTLVSDGIDLSDGMLFSNRYPSANYFIEIAQGAQERAWATATSNGTNLSVVATNFITLYTNVDSRPYYWYTNIPLTNVSGVVTGFTVFTNTYYTATTNQPEIVTNRTYDGFGFSVQPIRWDIDRTTYDPDARYITGLTTNYYTNTTISINRTNYPPTITTNTVYKTNITVQANMSSRDHSWSNAIDHFINRDLYTKVLDKTYELTPFFVNEDMVNTNGTYNGLTNASFPMLTVKDYTNVFGYTSGEYKQRESIWVKAGRDRVGLLGSDFTASGSTSMVTALVQSMTRESDPFITQSNMWRYADETNNGTWTTSGVSTGWADWTANDYNGDRYTRSTNWLAKHDILKSMEWINREATLTWTLITNSGNITFGAGIDSKVIPGAGNMLRKFNGSAYDRRGADTDTDEATAKSNASDDWDSSSWGGGSELGGIESWSSIYRPNSNDYSAVLEANVWAYSMTNDWPFDVVASMWVINSLNGTNDQQSGLGTGMDNVAPERNELFGITVPSGSLVTTAELGTRDKPTVYATTPGILEDRAHYGFSVDTDLLTPRFFAYPTAQWTPDAAANVYEFEGISYYSWAEAKALAEVNLIRGKWEPSISAAVNGTFGIFQVVAPQDGFTNKWTATIRMESVQGVIAGLNTNITKAIDWYAYAKPLGTNQFFTVEGNDVYWPTSFWYKIGSDIYGTDTHSATSSPLGVLSTTNTLPWCPDPQNATGNSTGRGWRSDQIRGIIKYDFEYCTNSL
jgi:hypothetical protein